MLSFRQYLEESRTLEIGRNPAHNDYRKSHADQMHDVLRNSYKSIGGYNDLGSGSKEESEAIHSDISNPNHHIQATIDRGKITSVIIKKKARLKKVKGRKLIAAGTNNSVQGKKDLIRSLKQSKKRENVSAEVSDVLGHIMKKIGYPEIQSSKVSGIIGKDVKPTGPTTYSRKIGGKEHEKTLVAFERRPKDT
jgi:hypothetical protein